MKFREKLKSLNAILSCSANHVAGKCLEESILSQQAVKGGNIFSGIAAAVGVVGSGIAWRCWFSDVPHAWE